MSLRCLFFVQGEGRGHMTQALALRRLLVDAGHEVTGVVMGRADRRTVPDFFRTKIQAPVTFVDSPSFVADASHRAVRPWRTIVRELPRMGSFVKGLWTIHDVVREHRPDVLVNFFEPTAGVYARIFRPDAPMVSIAHQYMFEHPTYRFPPGRWVDWWGTTAFARLTSWGSTRRLGLSLYPADPDAKSDLSVLPPLLREEMFDLPLHHTEPFFLVYIVNSGYAREIIRWHEMYPEMRLHCFWDRPDAAPVESYDDTLTFHQIDDRSFLDHMARCSGLVSTAGFEAVAEAMYLGKPVQVTPVEGHYEQLCNAYDTVRASAGIHTTSFNPGHLRDFATHYDADVEAFRAWLRSGRDQYVREIEAAAGRRPAPAPTFEAPASLIPAG